ncbi:TPA: YaiO family outer membrane beta-barrel protein [Salmonella enterica subsp. enterica]|uniref:YaiO beta-barrel domain-containing protein n=1 Tax=Salmonella enterica subsp. salamae TaxID=59202 RepID=A0A5Y3MXL7_SALER|nr:hypothetical protein [Salmonella enterica subsp. enterica serovar Veneziana]ECB4074224.1 YaiO family outer membrane beta-barrel protein [Salmonella enterica subsp. enterica serovar Napoli]ECD2400827.1 YaiO family outer membrane beta-barrel protein [Salmonella enterica subsp. enterica serovar Newport]ECI4012709.1 hypothetical protein [Salmonella enterica subsp. salamae]EDW8759694.1 YaiO family outer membrane beta-barrel protein [Salmonella enterica subsp. enterica]HBJ6783611.1 YaiO family ou
MNKFIFVSISAGVLSISANAKDFSLRSGYDYTDYSGGHGTRNIIFSELKNKIDHGASVINVSRGSRNYGDGKSWNAIRGGATVWYNWNTWISTRTGVSLAENSPVFARKDLQQDISFNLIPKTLLNFGYRFANYFGDTDVNAWSGGLSLYTGPLITSWKYTYYNTQDTGGSYSNIVSLRINDQKGAGNTQLWLSRGTGAYTYDWSPDTRKGALKSISIKRVQPLNERLILGLTLGKQWYNTPVDNYHNLQAIADISVQF